MISFYIIMLCAKWNEGETKEGIEDRAMDGMGDQCSCFFNRRFSDSRFRNSRRTGLG